MTAEDIIAEQKEIDAWWGEYLDRINFGIEIYNDEMKKRKYPSIAKFETVEDVVEFLRGQGRAKGSFDSSVAYERIRKLIDVSDSFSTGEPTTIEPLPTKTTSTSYAKKETETQVISSFDTMNNFFVVAMIDKWNERVREVLADEMHPDHNRLTAMLDTLEARGELGGDLRFFSKDGEGNWIVGKFLEEISEKEIEKTRTKGLSDPLYFNSNSFSLDR
jgi:hypothetical protein